MTSLAPRFCGSFEKGSITLVITSSSRKSLGSIRRLPGILVTD